MTYYIFEMANNHQGDVNHAKTIIDKFSDLSIDKNINAAIKFQFRQLDTFIHDDYCYCDLFNSKEIVTYSNINELNKKIIYYKNRPKLLKKIAFNGHKKAHKIFNNKVISDFIVKKSMNLKINNNLDWMDG